MPVGEICSKKISVINNIHLYNVGINMNLQSYIHTRDVSTMSFIHWDLPCFVTSKDNKSECNVQKNSIADMVESLIGACYCTYDSFETAWNFIFHIKIIKQGN